MTLADYIAQRLEVWSRTAPELIATHRQTLATPRLPQRVYRAAERELAGEEMRLAVVEGRTDLPRHWRESLTDMYHRQYR